ncbi:MAG: T9SS type A sorting domain-containing protein [Bacteroidetes bacterium]|nr:MAG: T9SS type A sorting domain-containing protein [Bacteroidota bacterium]
MKKLKVKSLLIIQLLIVSLVFNNVSSAQIRVDQDGHVGIGTIVTSSDSRAYIDCVLGNSYKTGLIIDQTSTALAPAIGLMIKHSSLYSGNPFEIITNGSRTTFINSIGGINTNRDVKLSFCNLNILGGQVNTTSDLNVKSNITEIDNPIELVLKINGYTYNYSEEFAAKHLIEDNHTRSGVIAQEIAEIMPWAVTEVDSVLTVDYNSIIPLLIEVVQYQNEQLQSLRQELNSINEALSTPQSEINEIKFYPNPASTSVVIEHGQNISNGSIGIFDLTGKTVLNHTINSESESTLVDISHLENGMYIFSVIQNGISIIQEQIIVTH